MSAALRQREPRMKSEKIRTDAKDKPCQRCGCEVGVINAHCNDMIYRGTGLKADDCLTAWLCQHCHDLLDGRVGEFTIAEKRREWDQAFKATVRQRFRLGLWRAT